MPEIKKKSESSENYLETIFILSRRLPVVRNADISSALKFKRSSVSAAVKKLKDAGQICVSPQGYITLTEAGLAAAQTLYEKHTFFADWLKKLGVDPETAEEDAREMEHVISEESFSAIKLNNGGRPHILRVSLFASFLFISVCQKIPHAP